MTRTVVCAWLLAMILWSVPIIVLQVVRAHRDRPVWAMALDVPFAIAFDLLSVLGLARFMHLETAVLVSRVVWVLAGIVAIVGHWCRDGTRVEWPSALRGMDVLAVAGAGALAIASCSRISYRFVVWDSGWHIPIVASIASQKLPFINPLSGTEVLHYHFSGDVLAAVIRTLSFNVISAPRALHTAHDLMFAAMAGTVTLLSIAFGLRRWWPAVLGGVAVVLQGPIPLRGGLGHAFHGYTYHLFMNLSYRPHVPVAGLMLVGALGTLAVRAAQPERVATSSTAYVLLAVIALLAVSDEASTAIVGIALGVAWLVDYRLLGRGRFAGLLLLIGIGVAAVSTNVVFAASLAPGSPVQTVSLVTPRVPPLWGGDPFLPLSASEGKRVLFWDFLPMTACAAALTLLAARLSSRTYLGVAIFVWSMIAITVGLVTCVEVNHDYVEAHRFFVAPFFACVVLAVVHLHQMPRGSLASVLVLLGVAVPAVYSVYWTREESAAYMTGQQDGLPPFVERVNDINCRVNVAAHFGDQAKPLYVDSAEFFQVASCRPVYQFGISPLLWPVQIVPVLEPLRQLRGLDEHLVARDQVLDAMCRAEGTRPDVVCERAMHNRSACRREGRYLRCPLYPADRDALLGRAPKS
jgi:hypothetical protein